MKGGVTARRAGIVFLCVLCFAACVGLAVWQWSRFQSSTGSWQNFGYTLLWPLFGLFPTFVVWRLRRLRLQEPDQPASGTSQPRPPVEPDKKVVRQTVPRQHRHAGEPEDPELAAYNRYLAELAERHQQETR